ncbi:DUF2807 domain-containing protein [Aquimarina sp. 2201CG1-2-11]|uniref:GIN domain-containing protein n=1 Tax=Aquimarina discodermiae TaxID=3231043 RepID=UPI003462F2CD
MKKTLITILLFTITITGFSQKKPKIKGNRNVTEISKEITEAFGTIEIDDALEVTLYQGDQNEYYLKTDENLIDIIQFKVQDDILKIYATNKIVRSKKLKIDVTITDINQIILRDHAQITINKKLSTKEVTINAYDSSQFDLSIEADDIAIMLYDKVKGLVNIKSESATLEMNGKADVRGTIKTDKIKTSLIRSTRLKLDGNADIATFDLKGSAKLNAKKMKIGSINLKTSNTADVNIYARKELELHARDKSVVYIYGNPKIDVKNLTEASKIIKK